MSGWHVSFEDILALHQSAFVAASQETRRGILRTVRDHIIAKNKSQDELVELPKALRKAIRRYYCQFLTDEDDLRAEEELLRDEQEDGTFSLSPEEREAGARPKDVAFYKKEVGDWDVAQRLFKQEIDEYDKEEQAKLGVKNEIKYRTGHARNWFKNMTPAQRKEVENAREKWNKEGAPPESQTMYRKRHLKKILEDFTEQIRRTMGCQVMILASHKKLADQTLNVIVHESTPVNSKKPFTQSSRGNKEWISEGFEKFAEWSKLEFYPEENDDDSNDEEEGDGKPSLPDVILDKNGYPKLPSRAGVAARGQQELVRQIFRASYKVFTDTTKPVPWREVVANPSLYLDPNSVPEGFILRDPSHMRAENINQLWAHWEARRAAKKKLVIFNAAKIGDMSKELLRNAVPHQQKTNKMYVEIEPVTASSSKGAASTHPTHCTTRLAEDGSSESESAGAPSTGRRTNLAESDSSEDESATAASRGRRTTTAARPSSAQQGAPATVPMKDRIPFLKSLSSSNEYLLLVEGIRDLRKEPSLNQQTEWPAWATWSWEGSYLPNDVHCLDGEVQKFLATATSTKITGLPSAMRVALGLGLLLRECKRAIEYEADEAALETPTYVSTSILDIKMLDRVIEAVKKVRGGLMHLLKSKDVQQEPAILGKAALGDGLRAKDGAGHDADVEEGVVREQMSLKLADELQKLEEENMRNQKLREENRKLEEAVKELQEANMLLAKVREEENKCVAGEQGNEEVLVEENKDGEEGEDEEEVVVEGKGKKRTKSGGSRKPSKKAKGDVRRSSRAKQPTEKAMKL
ncbi:hypothetical protein EV424DRAFT_1537908 [Suillus variegatus]|nr:hypothetical protein EV424DRAFT_1537908 [Suillus variegatus]